MGEGRVACSIDVGAACFGTEFGAERHPGGFPPGCRLSQSCDRLLVGALGVLNAEVWFDQERHPERPGRLELPATETLFLRIERLAPSSE